MEVSSVPQASDLQGVTHPSKPVSTSLAPGLKSPFTARINDTPLPSTWKGVTLDKYDGIIDSGKHIDIYVVQVGFYNMNDVVLCKVIPTSLKGQALSWFSWLTPNFIDCFKL